MILPIVYVVAQGAVKVPSIKVEDPKTSRHHGWVQLEVILFRPSTITGDKFIALWAIKNLYYLYWMCDQCQFVGMVIKSIAVLLRYLVNFKMPLTSMVFQ